MTQATRLFEQVCSFFNYDLKPFSCIHQELVELKLFIRETLDIFQALTFSRIG
jgi:hypothetical protein